MLRYVYTSRTAVLLLSPLILSLCVGRLTYGADQRWEHWVSTTDSQSRATIRNFLVVVILQDCITVGNNLTISQLH